MAVVLVKNLPRSRGAPHGEIADRIAAGRNDSFFYVAPTKRKVRQLRREFLANAPGGVSGPFSIFTLETLSEALFDILLPPPPYKKRLRDRMRAALVQEAIRTCARDLGYFTLRGPARRLPRGTLSRIANVINRLKSSGVYLSTIQEEIGDGGPGERLKLRDIALIYQSYERLLVDGGCVDPPGIVEAVNLEWTRPGSDVQFRARHPAVDLLAVTGFDEFSDPELTLLGYLSGVPGLATVVSFDYHPDNDHLFGHLKENYTKLLAMGFEVAGSPVRGMSPFHAHIARNLFAPATAGKAAPFDAKSIVTVCAAADRVREAELIAKIVRTEIADTPGLGPADVCVCMPRPEAYSAVIREVFEQAGIPANVTDRFYLEESSVVAGLVAVLQVAQNNFRIEDIMRAGTNPFLRIPAGAGTFDAPNLLRTGSELRTVSGRKRWVERIEARLRFLRTAHPDADDDDKGRGTRRAKAESSRLNDARRDIDALDRLVSGLRAPMRPAEFRDAVAGLAATLGVAASLAAAGSSGVRTADVERESRAFAEFLRFLDEFIEVLSIESPPAEAHPLSWFLERFRPLLSQVRYNVKQRYGEGVLVTSIDETRGLSFRVMVVAGLVDGEFPSVYEPEVFLTPKSRQRRERYHLHEQRYLFYQALSGCSGTIYLTRPLKENDVDLNPSGFLEWLEAAATIAAVPAIPNPGPGEGGPFAQAVVTADELLSRTVEEAARVQAAGGAAAEHRVPGHVSKAIGAEEARRRDAGGDLYRGILEPAALGPGAAARLAAYRNGTYSVTQLETYGDCPFRFFAGRVLGLRAPEEPEEGVTPREMGKLLHEILYDFYAERRERGLPPIAGIDDEGFEAAVTALKQIAARKFDETPVDDVFWEISRETVLGSQGSPGSPGRPGTPGTLEAMLAGERASGVSAGPAWFEVRFGKAGEDLKYSDPVMFSDDPAPAGGIFLQGKIDRIDADGDAFSILDYKTGSTIPSKKEVEEGASLQLPLYLHCAEWLLSERLGRPMEGGAGLYYHLKPEFEAAARIGNAEFRGRLLDPSRRFRLAADAATLRSQIDAAIATAGDRAGRISRGLFPVEPRDPAKLCRSCDYNKICRIKSRMPSDPGTGGDDGPIDNAQ